MKLPDNLNLTTKEESDIEAVSTRNIVLGLFALGDSLLVFILLIAVAKIKKPIKIILLNLLASDIVLMLCGALYGRFVQSQKDSSNAICLISVFFTIDGFLVCHAAVVGISFNNFLAIFYPFKHNILVSTKSVSIATVVTWFFLFLISGYCVATPFPTNLPCAVLGNIPRHCVVIIFCLLLIFDFSVIVMTMSISFALKKKRQIHANQVFVVSEERIGRRRHSSVTTHEHLEQGGGHPVDAAFGNPADGAPRPQNEDNSPSTSASIPGNTDAQRGRHPHEVKGDDHHQQQRTVRVLYFPKENIFKIDNRDKESTSLEKQTETDVADNDNINKDNNDELRVQRNQLVLLGGLQQIRSPDGGSQNPKLVKSNTMYSITTSRVSTKAKRNQFRRLSISMVIIAMWCCVCNVPCLIYLFYVAFIAEDRIQANYSTLGILFTTLLVVNVLGDPCIYAWRFIKWRTIVRDLKMKMFGTRH